MIKKTITINIPNEPFKTETSEGKTCNITYNGLRYLVISIDPATNIIQSQEGWFDTVAEFESQTWEDDKFEYHLIDADTHTLWAAFLSSSYSNENIPNYETTFQDVDGTEYIWTYDYSDDTGILDNIYERWVDYTYDPETDTFSDMVFVNPPVSAEEFNSSVQRTLDRIDDIDRTKQTDEINAELDTFREFFATISTKFPGIDGYKIPWPDEPFWDDNYLR